MLSFVNSFMAWYLKRRIPQMEYAFENAAEVQQQVFKSLLIQARGTSFGRDIGIKDIKTIEEFRARVPVFHYDDLKPYIQRVMQGEQKVLWPGEINWFAKSSGTTSDKSKFIPVSYDALEDCQFRGSRDVLAWYFYHNPEAKIFQGKALLIGGSHQVSELSADSFYGDLSAIMMNNLPFIANYVATPSIDIALMPDWEQKMQKMIESTAKENVTNVSGVPSWTMLVIKGVMERMGAKSILDVWPNLELYVHGGVSFAPYRSQFSELVGKNNIQYRETYNASEGFFGIQDAPDKDMMLMMDYGIFYEFIRLEEFNDENPRSYWIDEVELNQNYAIIINTNAGLWRYVIGDTIKFTSKKPYRFVISGRTKSFINAFGEELMVENAERALSATQKICDCMVSEFTAGPVYLTNTSKGRHEWLIEFAKEPADLERFSSVLDEELKKCNSDYEAKRRGDLALLLPLVHQCEPGTFYKWLKSKQKLGGQHKVPKLSNDRRVLDEILKIKNDE